MMILGCLLLGNVPALLQAEEVTRTQLLVSTCFNCHGPGGKGSGRIPELSDLDADEIKENLYGYRAEAANDRIMEHQAKGLTEAEIELIANYFDALK
jgi:cytochrome c553